MKTKNQLLNQMKQSKYVKGFLFNHAFCHNCKQLIQPNGAAFFENIPLMVEYAEKAHNESGYLSEITNKQEKCVNARLVLAYQPSLIHSNLLSDINKEK